MRCAGKVSKMLDDRPVVAAILFVLVMGTMLAVGAWWNWRIWSECREVGHTVLYCLGMLH